MKTKAKVMVDEKGNRMVFPSMMYTEDCETVPLETWFWQYAMQMRMATGLVMEDAWFIFDDANFPHIVTEIYSRGFEHGGTEVYLFDGPKFKEIVAEIENA